MLAIACTPNSPYTPDPPHKSEQTNQTPTQSVVIPTSTPPSSRTSSKHGGVLTLANRGDPPSGFDSLRTSSIALHHVSGTLFGPGNLVMRCRENMYMICPYLAKSWTVNQAFTEWIFTIRDDVIWHDGLVFSATDAKFWLDLAYFGATNSQQVRAPAYFKGDLGDINETTVLTHNRLKVSLNSRNPHFLSVLANPRFKLSHPEHIVGPRIQDDPSISPADIGLIGLGPFRVSKYEPGVKIEVRRFEQYWERDENVNLPYLDGIDYVIIPNPFTMDVALRTGRLDGGARGQQHYLSSERKLSYVRDLGDKVWFAEMDGGNFRLAFNVLKPGPWQNPDVRRAIALWIDKRSSIDYALGGFGWTSPDLGHPNIVMPIGRAKFINWPKFDIEPIDEKRQKAITMMKQAGHPDGFRMGHLCRGINLSPCEYLRSQLSGLGIELQIHVVDEGEWNRARSSLDYDSQQGRLSPSPIPEGTESVYGRYEDNPDAYSKHDDYKVDRLYANLRNAITPDSRVELWRAIERYMFVDRTYIVPIAESVNVLPYRSYVRGVVVPMEDGHTHTDFATVWLDRNRDQ